MKPEHYLPAQSRRDFLMRSCGGLGALAFSSMLQGTAPADPLAPKKPHHEPKAKSVIWLFMEGGPSHIDLFDPKPALEKMAGQPLPASFGQVMTAMGTDRNGLLPSKRTFKQYGQSGIWVSDWYPQIAQHVDKMTVLRSCRADGLNHVGSVCQMNTGDILAGRPAMGAWVQYGLGAANHNLPAFVVLLDDREPIGGVKNWSSGFLPGVYQGTQFRSDGAPILNLLPPDGVGDRRLKGKLDFLANLNRRYQQARQDDAELEARIRSYELAFRMQAEAPEAVDMAKETASTKHLYGMDDPVTEKFGTNCLLA